ncbi:MAG: FABP family protein, partial [Mycobacteriales bacterium]
ETGYWRPGAGDRDLEVLITHPSGLLELSVGEVTFHKIEVVSDLLARTETAKEVTAISRLYGMVDGDLAYALDMSAVGKPLQPHLSAKLQRED